MPHADQPRAKRFADGSGQILQADQIGDMAARLANLPRQGFLAMSIFIDQPAIGFALFDRIKLFALDILDQRNLKRGAVVKFLDDDRHLMDRGALCRAPAPFARDDLEFAGDFAHDNWLKHAAQCNRCGELIKRSFVKMFARLIG